MFYYLETIKYANKMVSQPDGTQKVSKQQVTKLIDRLYER